MLANFINFLPTWDYRPANITIITENYKKMSILKKLFWNQFFHNNLRNISFRRNINLEWFQNFSSCSGLTLVLKNDLGFANSKLCQNKFKMTPDWSWTIQETADCFRINQDLSKITFGCSEMSVNYLACSGMN